jgi:hypothetical protein
MSSYNATDSSVSSLLTRVMLIQYSTDCPSTSTKPATPRSSPTYTPPLSRHPTATRYLTNTNLSSACRPSLARCTAGKAMELHFFHNASAAARRAKPKETIDSYTTLGKSSCSAICGRTSVPHAILSVLSQVTGRRSTS